jgi:hypothetical protein
VAAGWPALLPCSQHRCCVAQKTSLGRKTSQRLQHLGRAAAGLRMRQVVGVLGYSREQQQALRALKPLRLLLRAEAVWTCLI